MRSSRLRAAVRLALFALINIALVPAYVAACGPLARLRPRLRILYCRLANQLIGLSVRAHGTICADRAVLFVANHVSYLDVPVLGSLIEAAFVAKAEVARWPLFGLIGRLTRTVFIERSGGDVMAQRDQMVGRFAAGDSLILFPEGTSTDGSGVRAFKSSLFSITDGAAARRRGGMKTEDVPPVTVQPVSVAYTRYADGTPLTGPHRSLYCWFGGATFLPHFWRVLGLRGGLVDVTFHPPLRTGDWRDRKDLARKAHGVVAAGVAAAHRGAAADAEGGRSGQGQAAAAASMAPGA
jgi:1-acyl-sn-glycerol-3-phosphate acyltransferase